MSKVKIETGLVASGWLPKPKRKDQQALERALRSYAKFHGVSSKSHRTIERHMGMRFCGAVDRAEARSRVCRWPKGHEVTWTISQYLTGISRDDFRDTCAAAWSSITRVCGLKLRYVPNEKTANVMIGIMRQRPGDVLADMELPCGATPGSRRRNRVDDAENWATEPSDLVAPGEVSLLTVERHEFCHAAGMNHLPWDGRPTLLNATYSREAPGLGPREVDWLQKVYGPPDEDEPGDDPGGEAVPGEGPTVVKGHMRVYLDGAIYEVRGNMRRTN